MADENPQNGSPSTAEGQPEQLLDQVKVICDRLHSKGWGTLLLAVTNNGLNISQSSNQALSKALTDPLSLIDRKKPGFQDLDRNANSGIARGHPARSLLYHALASPAVHPTETGEPSPNRDDYPTLDELDTIENFIYSLAADRTDLGDTVVGVFAYQYREASRTSHKRHADLAFSRTGVSRVGTAVPNYDPSRRSFWVIPENGGDGLPVLPARYGVFLARKRKPGPAGSVQGGHAGAADSDYLFPVHKLFPGTECIRGSDLTVEYLEFHRTEKLAKTHRLSVQDGGLPVPDGFDISKTPYVRDATNGGNLATLKSSGATVLVVPQPGDPLVRTVSQRNSVTNTEQIVHFIVPPQQIVRDRSTRFESSLEIPAFGNDRLSPEYVNIRHRIDPFGPPDQKPEDLNDLREADFKKAMRDGNYSAAHFSDNSCDGCVESVVTGLPASAQSFPAFSLITAPDFFPLADQLQMESDETVRRVEPLSKGRLPVNPAMPRPSNLNAFAFNREELTVTAIVGNFATGSEIAIDGRPNRQVSFLPDGASNVFAPGWDVSRSRDSVGPFLTSFGLGSPFPEDAKLCAALASFWPAVAPDNGRTFGNRGFGNQLPMLDEELGFHPNHPGVQSGEVTSFRGWDGEFGPFFETIGEDTFVNFVPIERSDYVSRALNKQIKVSLTAEVQSADLIARNQALEACERVLNTDPNAGVCLVMVCKIADWATEGRGHPELSGGGFLLEFAEFSDDPKPTDDLGRVRQKVLKKHICQVGSNGVAYKKGDRAFEFRR